MKPENSVFFISKSEKAAAFVREKLMFSRAADKFVHIGYENCYENVKLHTPQVIFYDIRFNQNEFFEFLKKVKATPALDCSSIILIFEKVDEELLCSAFEGGITDFLTFSATDSEFTVRVLWAFRKKGSIQAARKKTQILSNLNILDKKTGIYTKNYTYTILKEESKRSSGTLAVVAPDVASRAKLTPEILARTAKKCLRKTDILGFSGDFKLYIWFPDTSAGIVVKILKKIEKKLPDDVSISAGIYQSSSFDQMEENANKALSDALLKENSFVIYSQIAARKSEETGESYKNFNSFKQNFLKKYESEVSPVFYRTQKIIEEKLFKTSVNQKIDENESVFSLTNENCKSTFRVTYPAYAAINIDITHDNGFETRRRKTSFGLKELDGDRIGAVLDDFIKEFQTLSK